MSDKKESKRLVIDASVARASGNNRADMQSSRSRELLQTVINVCHRVVFTDAITEEWKRHQSRFAITWLKSMYAKRKVVRIAVVADEELRSKATTNASEADKTIMLKDFILIEAALATDHIVMSRDKEAGQCFATACKHAGAMSHVMWVSPEDADVNEWLANGAEVDASKQLRNKSK